MPTHEKSVSHRRGPASGPKRALGILVAVLCSSVPCAIAQERPPAPVARFRVVDFLDGAALVDAYLDQKNGEFVSGLKLAHGRVRDTLEIPVGSIQASAGGSAAREFSIQLLSLDDLDSDRTLRLVYVGRESLSNAGFAPGQEVCLHFDPLADRRVMLGSLLGMGRPKPVADPGPLARLQHVQLDDLDGVLLRIPGTMEICSPIGVFTIGVMSAEGVCRERIEGSITHYRCEHFIGDSLRSSAEMFIDPSARTANCEKTTGGGGCFIDEYPKDRPASSSATPPARP